jgi:aspartokinase/homoserine dehydrogenase 1
MLIDPNNIDPENWKQRLELEGSKTNLDKMIEEMKRLNLPNSIFVDCTASDLVAGKYKEILDASISVVTPNKRANSGSYKYYQALKQSALKHNVKFLYETNVGAGLPIINTLSDLVSSGDKVLKIQGVMSGTLSYIFSSYKDGKSFSQIVREAKEKGFTEPDPREDLNGMDVARKLLILARETGLSLELKDIKVENLVPAPARKTKSIEEFFKKLAEYDKKFEEKRKRAADKGNVLRYVATLENGKGEISLIEVNNTHPFYSLTGSDNIFAFYTTHYRENPIVIKGPGAGADVTAAGVFADIIRISNYLS